MSTTRNQDALADLITEHVLTTKAVVDAQASGDAAAAAAADPLASAIVAKLPDQF